MDRQSKTDGESGGDSTFDVILVILSVLMPRYQLFGVHTTNQYHKHIYRVCRISCNSQEPIITIFDQGPW